MAIKKIISGPSMMGMKADKISRASVARGKKEAVKKSKPTRVSKSPSTRRVSK